MVGGETLLITAARNIASYVMFQKKINKRISLYTYRFSVKLNQVSLL